MSFVCTRTYFKNTSGAGMHFSLIPPYGQYLDANEQNYCDGDIFQLLAKSPQKTAALQAAIDGGYLEILQTPASIYFDDTDAVVKIIDVDNGAVVVEDPCYGSYSGGSAPS